MRFKQLFYIALATLASTMFVACSSDDVDPEILPQEGKVNYFEKAIDFTSDGGSVNVCFSTNVDWTLTASSTQGGTSWCNVSQSSGKAGDFSIVVTAEPNTGYDDRNVVLTLTADKVVKTVIVNQKQKNAITLTSNRFEVDKDGGNFDVVAKANVDYTVEIPAQYKSWISQTPSTRGLTSKSLSFTVAKSEEYDKREGEILFKSGELTETIKVYQTGSAILVLSQNEYTIGSEGGTISIDISSNFDFVVDMPNVSWLKAADKTRAVSSHTLVYQVDPNTTYDDREAVIIFKDSKSDRRESVTIKQRQKNGILLSTPKAEIGQDGGTFYVEVNSNVDYQIEIPSSCRSWISRASSSAPTRALSKSTPAFKVSQNQEYAKREGEIYFKYGDIKETFKVYQSGGPCIILSQDKFELSGKSSTIEIVLKSNIEYTETISDESWITPVATRAISSTTKQYTIALNESGKERKGTITFKTSDDSKTATVSITQQPIKKVTSIAVLKNFMSQTETYGNYWYIGKSYYCMMNASPYDADYKLECSIEDPEIAEIRNRDGLYFYVYTKNYGTTNIVVKDKVSGMEQKVPFTTLVENFTWQIDADSYWNSFPQVTITVGDTYKISKYSCKPSYATNLFSDLSAFKFWENVGGIMGMLDTPTHISVEKDGTIKGVSVGRTGMGLMGDKVFRSGDDQRFYVNVISEYAESEYNNEFSSANMIKEGQAMKFSLSSSSDVDVFKFKVTSSPYMTINMEYLGESGASSNDSRLIRYEVYDSSYKLGGSGTLTFKAKGEVCQPMLRYVGNGTYAYLRLSYPSNYGNALFPYGYFKASVASYNQ